MITERPTWSSFSYVSSPSWLPGSSPCFAALRWERSLVKCLESGSQTLLSMQVGACTPWLTSFWSIKYQQTSSPFHTWTPSFFCCSSVCQYSRCSVAFHSCVTDYTSGLSKTKPTYLAKLARSNYFLRCATTTRFTPLWLSAPSAWKTSNMPRVTSLTCLVTRGIISTPNVSVHGFWHRNKSAHYAKNLSTSRNRLNMTRALNTPNYWQRSQAKICSELLTL